MKTNVRNMVVMAMLCALAFLIAAVVSIPMFNFLSFEPKDAIIAIAGFIFGPLYAALISTVVALIEMVTVSATGIIGFVMNVISTCAFVCPAAIIYKRNRTLRGALTGLIVGVFVMTAAMLIWNYLITPLYMGVPRDQVALMLLPTFLPFNFLKGGVNAALTMLLYKPVVKALRQMRLLPESTGAEKSGIKLGRTLVISAALVTLVLLLLVVGGVI